MSTILKLDQFASSNIVQNTRFAQDEAVAQTELSLENASNFVVDEYALLGSKGVETSEIGLMSAVADNKITVPATEYAHSITDPAYQLFGNQIRIYRAANVDGTEPDSGDFSLLATETIEADKLMLDYTDSTGGSDYWYKQTYYNSNTSVETDSTLATATRGGGYGRYTRIDRVRKKAGLEDNPDYSDIEIDESIIEAQSEVDSALTTAGYTLPLTSVPPMIAKVTRWIAVADLLGEAYDSRAEGTNKESARYREMANQYLDDLISGGRNLLDEIGNVIPKASKVDYQPDANVSDFFFKRDDVY